MRAFLHSCTVCSMHAHTVRAIVRQADSDTMHNQIAVCAHAANSRAHARSKAQVMHSLQERDMQCSSRAVSKCHFAFASRDFEVRSQVAQFLTIAVVSAMKANQVAKKNERKELVSLAVFAG